MYFPLSHPHMAIIELDWRLFIDLILCLFDEWQQFNVNCVFCILLYTLKGFCWTINAANIRIPNYSLIITLHRIKQQRTRLPVTKHESILPTWLTRARQEDWGVSKRTMTSTRHWKSDEAKLLILKLWSRCSHPASINPSQPFHSDPSACHVSLPENSIKFKTVSINNCRVSRSTKSTKANVHHRPIQNVQFRPDEQGLARGNSSDRDTRCIGRQWCSTDIVAVMPIIVIMGIMAAEWISHSG